MNTLPIYGLSIKFGTSDAAGCNWSPKSLQDIDLSIDYDLAVVYRDKNTNEYTIFVPNMPHSSKYIVTALELSGVKKSKRKVKYGKCPMYLLCIKYIWLALGGGVSQLQETKLTKYHIDTNVFL
jgi:hypothetical protein